MTFEELASKYQGCGMFTGVIECFSVQFRGGFEMFGAYEDWRFGYRVVITHVPTLYENSVWAAYPRKLDKPIVAENKVLEVAIADAWKRASVA